MTCTWAKGPANLKGCLNSIDSQPHEPQTKLKYLSGFLVHCGQFLDVALIRDGVFPINYAHFMLIILCFYLFILPGCCFQRSYRPHGCFMTLLCIQGAPLCHCFSLCALWTVKQSHGWNKLESQARNLPKLRKCRNSPCIWVKFRHPHCICVIVHCNHTW